MMQIAFRISIPPRVLMILSLVVATLFMVN